MASETSDKIDDKTEGFKNALRSAVKRGAKVYVEANRRNTNVLVCYRNNTYDVTGSVREMIGARSGSLPYLIDTQWTDARADNGFGEGVQWVYDEISSAIGVPVDPEHMPDDQYFIDEVLGDPE
jgi:hypothetical protein